jgi:hypothetical protein
MAKADSKRLAEQACRALTEGEYGQYDSLIERLAPVLGAIGLEHLKRLVLRLSRERPSTAVPITTSSLLVQHFTLRQRSVRPLR